MRKRETYHVLSRIRLRQHLPRSPRRHLEIRYDRHGFDVRTPLEPPEMPYILRWNRGSQTCIDTSRGLRQDFGQRHLFPRHVVWIQLVEVCPHEPAVEGRGDIVRVALDHQCEVEDA